jgi:UDP-N-acetyl-D-glucosamine dehydrogenase
LLLALLFSEQSFRVTGFDVDRSKVNMLNASGSNIVRITTSEIDRARGTGFRATRDYAKIGNMDAIIICGPTPRDEFHQTDLSFVEKTAQAIAPNLRDGQLVLPESTTYPGTTEEVLIPILESGGHHGLHAVRQAGKHGFFVAFSPEREDPGNDSVTTATFQRLLAVFSRPPRLSRQPYMARYLIILCPSPAGCRRDDQAA